VRKTGWTGFLMICTSYDMFLRKDLPFGGRDDCTSIKIFSGVNFFKIAVNSLTR